MSRDQKEICLNCKFWHCQYAKIMKDEGQDALRSLTGDCRISRPVLTQWGSYNEGLSSSTAWPQTKGGYWCGEFAPHPPLYEEDKRFLEAINAPAAKLERENWQLKAALGYPIPSEFDTPNNPFKCGICDARGLSDST